MDSKMFNLTYPQKNIWLVDKYNGKTAINSIIGTIEIKDKFNERVCKEAINYVIKVNDALRISIEEKDGKVFQYIKEFYNYDVEVIDMTDYNQEQIVGWKRNTAKILLDVEKGELYHFYILKYSENSGAIYMKIHHLVCDAWSCGKMATQAIKYIEKKYGIVFENEEKSYSYIEYIESEKKYINSDKFIKDENFWKEYLNNVNEPISLKDSTIESKSASRYNVKLTQEFTDKINKYCKENKISQYVLFLTALSTYLYRIKNNNDFIIGTPVLNRSNFKEKNMVGMFVSTLPLRVKINENDKFVDLASSISSNTLTLFRYQKYPYTKMLEFVRKNVGTNKNLYNIVLSYQNIRADIINDKIYSTTWPFTEILNDELQIHIMDMDSTGTLNIKYDYLSSLFDENEIKCIHTRIMEIIQNAIDNININVDEIEIMTCDEKKYLLNEINNNINMEYYKKHKSVIDMFLERVKENPNDVALIFENKEYTYKELDVNSNKLANYLIKEKCINKGDIISIAMKRSDQIIISMLAILKIRATYLLIDTTYPENRILSMIKSAKLVITDNKEVNWLKNIDYIDIYTESKKIKEYNCDYLNLNLLNDQLDYIIYTSGSTGDPKGIMISDKNLLNFCIGINEKLKFNRKTILVSITTISFDIFGLEVWLTLLNGGKIILANDSQCINQDELNNLCIKFNVNTIQSTPTKLKFLTSNIGNIGFISNMKNILLGGESIPINYVKFLQNNTKSKIYNVYGPSETTIWSTIKDITKEDYIDAGKPIQNTSIYILDEKERLLPLRSNGQICISGDSVSMGYYNRKDLTDKSFIKFNDKIVYKTGDLGFINFNGELSVLGRIDHQIKLNGQRIELEEIENKIREYENIRDAVVIKNKKESLVCFYTLKDSRNLINIDKLRKKIIESLPSYMIPHRYVYLDELPQTLNNKIDRKKLIDYKIEEDITDNEIILPKTDLQYTIYNAWKKVLKEKEFGINTNFFDLGTDSLDAIKVQIELMSQNIKITYEDLQRYSNILELEEKIINNDKLSKVNIYEKKDFSDILNKNVLNEISIPKYRIKKVILTGVTGFLGAHILDRLIQETDATIYCLIRERDNKNIEDRLNEKLKFFFDKRYEDQIGNRIIPIKSDIIENENFGVELDDLEKISDGVDFIIHAAACVKHYGDYEYFYDVNVRSTQNVVKFALKNNIKLIHISTISVSGNSFEGAIIAKNKETSIFDETMLYNGQDLNNVYVNTKFKAEEIVLEYMKKGLLANILRIGNLTSRMSDYKFQPNIEENAFVNRLKTFINIGKFPKENMDEMYIEFTPVDEAAKSIVIIMQHFNSVHNMFHIFNHNHVYLKDLLKILKNIGIYIDIVDNDEFRREIKNISNSKNRDTLSGIINDLSDDYTLDYAINVKVKSDITIKYLKSIGFEWNKITEKYIINYINNLKEIGFLKF